MELRTSAFYLTFLLLIGSCMTLCLYNFVLSLCVVNEEMTEKKVDIINTIFICLHAVAGCVLVFRFSSPIRAYPGSHKEIISSLKQLKTKLNGCSDELTQIHTPGPIEYLESDSFAGAYIRILYIWLWMLILLAYAIYVGIIKHVQHYRKKKEFMDTVGDVDQGKEQNMDGPNVVAQQNISQVPL